MYHNTNISSLAYHQNLRLLERFDMSIDIEMQQNKICLNPLLKLSLSPLDCIQKNLKKIGIIS